MYRLFALLGLMAVAVVGLVLGSEIASAHTTGAYHWHWIGELWTGEDCYRLYYPSGGPTNIVRCY